MASQTTVPVSTCLKITKYSTGEYRLRRNNPLIPLERDGYDILVEESEKIILIASTQRNNRNFVIETSQRVNDVHPCCDNHIYFSFYNSSTISAYRKFRYYSVATNSHYISIEYADSFRFPNNYLAFDIDDKGVALVFSLQNTIEVYQTRTIYFLDFVRRLPMYTFKDNWRFVTNARSPQPVFRRLNECLYIVMANILDPLDRRIFIYKLDRPSHDSLNKIIQLDKEYGHLDTFLFTEKLNSYRSVFVYVFYDANIYQFITYEPDSALIHYSNKNSEILQLKEWVDPHRDELVMLKVFPLKTMEAQTMNETIDVWIHCTNQGLMINQRGRREPLSFTNEHDRVRIAMLDQFTGYNMSYSLKVTDVHGDKQFSYSLSHDTVEEYLIEAVNGMVHVAYAFDY